jgi:two-component system CheB/CheR fusion protein
MSIAFPATECPDGLARLPVGAETLLRDLCAVGGLDFASYKLTSLLRRVRGRMTELGVAGFDAYRAYLSANPDEHRRLVRAVPVHRTEFFRDADCWAHLAAEVIPRLVESGRPIRAWSAGCATGEEAYTLAMLLAEAAGRPAVTADRVRVYATDVSEAAVAHGRAGWYPADAVLPIAPDLAARYFRPHGDGYVVCPELRRCVVFARHDLLTDPPLGRLDLVACRNTLMYFTPDAQVRALARLYFALAQGGYLLTGAAERAQVSCDFFATASCEHNLYRRVGRQGQAEALAVLHRWRRRPPGSRSAAPATP